MFSNFKAKISKVFSKRVGAVRITTSELVNRIFNFCELYSGTQLYPYQEQFGKRVIRSVLDNDSAEITALFSRQCICKGQMVLMADYTEKLIEDLQVGDKILSYDELEDELVEDEVFEVWQTFPKDKIKIKSKFNTLYCSTDHLIRVDGDWRRANLLKEGDIITGVDEEGEVIQDVVESVEFLGQEVMYDVSTKINFNFIVEGIVTHNSGKSETISVVTGGLMIILPLMANMPMFAGDTRLEMFKGGISVGIFAPSLRQAQITFNRIKSRIQSRSAQLVLQDPEINLTFTTSNGQTVALSNGSFATSISASDGASIEGESFMLIILEECQDISDFKINKCLSYDTKVLLEGGEYKTIEDVVRDKRDSLMCFDEEYTRLTSKVPYEFFDNGVQDVYRVTLEDGQYVDCTLTHRFPSYYKSQKERFKMRTLEEILFLTRSEVYLFTSLDLDAEGVINYVEDCPIGLSPKKISDITYLGKEKTYCVNMSKEVEGIHNIIVNGSVVTGQSILPMGSAYNASIVKIGTATTYIGDFYNSIQRNKKAEENITALGSRNRNHFEYDYLVASKYNLKYEKFVKKQMERLGEHSDEFRMSFKLHWIVERGMFLDIRKFEHENGDPNLERVDRDLKSNYVAGIDLGGKGDDTVITIVEVDWDMPVILEESTDEETGEDQTYVAYNSYLVDWHRINDVPDFEEQYSMIMDYLARFNVSRLVIDATREAGVAHRLRANVNFEVIPFITTPKSKSELYKHLEREINSKRAKFTASEKTQGTLEYKMFLEQFGDLQKNYRGQYLVVHHPQKRGAHDDFPDSYALAVWGCRGEVALNHAETAKNNSFYSDKANVFQGRRFNRVTAKRRG